MTDDLEVPPLVFLIWTCDFEGALWDERNQQTQLLKSTLDTGSRWCHWASVLLLSTKEPSLISVWHLSTPHISASSDRTDRAQWAAQTFPSGLFFFFAESTTFVSSFPRFYPHLQNLSLLTSVQAVSPPVCLWSLAASLAPCSRPQRAQTKKNVSVRTHPASIMLLDKDLWNGCISDAVWTI